MTVSPAASSGGGQREKGHSVEVTADDSAGGPEFVDHLLVALKPLRHGLGTS